MDAGVPVVAIPLFGHEYGNAATLVDAGIATIVNYENLNKQILLDAINDVLDPGLVLFYFIIKFGEWFYEMGIMGKKIISILNVKRGVEFHYSTRNASKIQRKMGSVLTKGSFCLPCCVRNTA